MTINKTKQTSDSQFWLRPLSLEHLPAIGKWYEQIEDISLFDRRAPAPVSGAAMEAGWREIISAPEPRTSYWFVMEDDAGDAAGLAGLQEINHVHGDAVIAVFVSRRVRRRGIGIRSCALLLDLAFKQLRLNRVTSYYRADNLASQGLTEACGFSREGCIRQSSFSAGDYIDRYLIGVLAKEWLEHREGLQTRLDPGTVVTLGQERCTNWSWPAIPSQGPSS